MANRWKGNFIVATEATSSGTAYTGKANGSWSLNNQIQQKQANLWAKGVGAPTAPTIGTATAGNANASVAFTASSDAGAPGSLTYTATSTPGSFTNTGSSSPIVVSGLTNGTQYTFKVNATNSLGYVSPDSAASNSTGTTVPGAPTIGTATGVPGGASITFTPPSNTGNLTITGYTATSSPGSITGTAASSPVTVSGLTNGTAYTFTVVATNALGNSSPSAASNSITNSDSAIAVSMFSTPFVQAYTWSSGFGAKYTNPASLPPSISQALSFNNAGTSLVVADSTAGVYLGSYSWSTAGFGTRTSHGGLIPGFATEIVFNSSQSLIGFSHATSPFLTVCAYSGTTIGSKYANPSVLPAGQGISLDFNPTSTALAFGSDGAGVKIGAYAWSSGFGTKYAAPTSAPPTNATGMSAYFSKNGNSVAFSVDTSPFVYTYAWSSGFGTKYADPTTLPNSDSRVSRYNLANNVIALATSASPAMSVYSWSGSGFGTKFANPATVVTGAGYGIEFALNDSIIFLGGSDSPYLSAYAWSNSTGFGAKYANPSVLPNSCATGNTPIAFKL